MLGPTDPKTQFRELGSGRAREDYAGQGTVIDCAGDGSVEGVYDGVVHKGHRGACVGHGVDLADDFGTGADGVAVGQEFPVSCSLEVGNVDVGESAGVFGGVLGTLG